MLRPGEITVDSFAGGGGASIGMFLGCGRHVDIAINHNPPAIAMHRLNHPNTEHYCESVWDVDPVKACRGRPVGWAHFSPDCRHFSKAKGGKPVDKNIRGLAWVALKWAMDVPVRNISIENVEEFLTWGPVIEIAPGNHQPCPRRRGETFDGFIKALTTGLSPRHPAWKEAVAALGIQYDVAARLKLKKGLGYHWDYKIMTASDYGIGTTRTRLFIRARNDGLPIHWPDITHGNPKAPAFKQSGLKPWVPIADAIDWSLPGQSIFNRPRPLAEKTLQRIAKGLQKFVLDCDDPYLVDGDKAAFIIEHANASSQRVMPINEPLRTICAQVKGGHFGLVTAHIMKMRGSNVGHSLDQPLQTISAGGNHFALVMAFIVKYYGTNVGHSLNEPLQTITTKDRFGLVTVMGGQGVIVDITMRMLQPHELFKTSSFPHWYKFSHDANGKKIPKAEQVARVGNAVPPKWLELLMKAENQNQQQIAVA